MPEETIRRRYDRSLANVFSIDMTLVDAGWVYNDSGPGEPKCVVTMIHPTTRHDLFDLLATEELTIAIQGAMREAVLEHARAGHPVSGWKDGKVVWYQPREILATFADGQAISNLASGAGAS